MHQTYGPVVRTRPEAVHINDPFFIEKLYTLSPKQRRHRAWTFIATMQLPGSMLASADHDLHRRRRAALNPFFSRQNVRRLEPVINDTLQHLLRRMEGWERTGEPVQMNAAFRAATKDIIQAYALGAGDRCLDKEDCNKAFFEVMAPTRIVHVGTYLHTIVHWLSRMPPVLMKALMPNVGTFASYVEVGSTALRYPSYF